MGTDYFFTFIEQLRREGHVILYNNVLEIPAEESQRVLLFLEKEFEHESQDYAFEVPPFDHDAALYACTTLYRMAQLLLYRQHKADDIPKILLPYEQELMPSAIVSADLLFRFLPSFRTQFLMIDFEDEVLKFIDALSAKWHYSAMASIEEVNDLDFKPILSNPCVKRLYTDRIIALRKQSLAALPHFRPEVESILGIYKNEFWSTYQPTL